MLTKHRVFRGPGFQVAVELADAANGGQARHIPYLLTAALVYKPLFPPGSGRHLNQGMRDIF